MLLTSDEVKSVEDVLYKKLFDALESFQVLNARKRDAEPSFYQNIKKGLGQAIEDLEKIIGEKDKI